MLQFVANGLCRGATYSVVALGFGLIYTTTGVFHLAHGAVYVSAAYALYFSLVVLHLGLPVAVGLSLLVAASLGLASEFFVYYPLARRRSSSAVLLVSSLGLYTVIVNVVALLAGNEAHIVDSGIVRTFSYGRVVLTSAQVVQLATGAAAIALYAAFLGLSPLGRVCRAVADDPILASVLGVRVERTRLLVFGVGSLMAGLGALLVALDVGMDPFVGFPIVMVSAAACIVGGLHRFVAPALGGILLGEIQSLIVWQTSAKWESAATFGVLIAFLLIRPQGLLGIQRRADER